MLYKPFFSLVYYTVFLHFTLSMTYVQAMHMHTDTIHTHMHTPKNRQCIL